MPPKAPDIGILSAAQHLATWDPVIAGIIAARDGDDQARAAVDECLAHHAGSPDWGTLAAALRAILNDGPGVSLPAGLDAIDTVITRRAQAALTGENPFPAQLWPAIPLTGLIAQVVRAAYGDQDIAQQVTESLTTMDTNAELAPLAAALRRMLDGDRAPALARDLGPVPAAVVLTILLHLPPAAPQPPMITGSR